MGADRNVQMGTSGVTNGRRSIGTEVVAPSVLPDMQHLIHRITTLILLVTMVASACGSASDQADDPFASAEPTSGPTTDATEEPEFELEAGPLDIVLQIDEKVNQPDPFAIAAAQPWFTLYGDGTVVYRDRTAEPSALPPLMQARVTPEGAGLLLQATVDAGVFGSPDTGVDPTIADGSTIYIRAGVGEDAVDYSIGDNRGLRDFGRRLEQSWQEIVGDEIVDDPRPYDFESVLVIARADRADATAGSNAPVLPFDLREAEEFATRVLPVSCVELTTDDFDDLRPAVATIDTPYGSTWRSGTASGTPASGLWYVIFRQLLPHENGCGLVADR